MKESGGLSVQRVSETNSIVSDFIPPMSDSGDAEPPNKKRRQISLEPSPAALGDVAVAVVEEPHVGSSESSNPAPASSPASVPATTTEPDTSEDRNERTSKDYYFDSYSHHAIRKFESCSFLADGRCRAFGLA